MRRSRLPPHIVAMRSKYSTPATTASAVDVAAKYSFGDRPVVNRWWPQTLIERAVKTISESTNGR